MGVLTKTAIIAKDHGFAALLPRIMFAAYRRTIRPLMRADGFVLYAGIPVGRERRLGDKRLLKRFLPPDLQDNGAYEQGLVTGLRSTIRRGDKVVVVGGGEGITAAIAALLTGASGSVICFEGDRAGIESVKRTAEANNVPDRVECIHAVVGPNIGVFGSAVSDVSIAPQDLPECDVMEMDCEGSEVQILREMVIRPRAVVVETHGFNGAPTALVTEILERRGYEVEDLGLAEPKAACIGRDEHVLLALHH